MERRAGAALAVVALLLVKHFLFDFVFQTRFQLENKRVYGHPGGLVHAGLHVVGTLPAFLVITPSPGLGAAILGAEFVVHYHIDWIKEQILLRTRWSYSDGRFWATFGGDQLAHALGYLLIAWILVVRA